MAQAGFELAIPVSERPQTHALDRAATGITVKQCLYVRMFDKLINTYPPCLPLSPYAVCTVYVNTIGPSR